MQQSLHSALLFCQRIIIKILPYYIEMYCLYFKAYKKFTAGKGYHYHSKWIFKVMFLWIFQSQKEMRDCFWMKGPAHL